MGGDDDTTIMTFDEQADQSIRRVEVDGNWYFSVIDVIGLLTDATKPRQYWYDMKRYIQTEGFVEVSEKIRRLKLVASDGKLRLTDAADVTTLLRIIQSIPSPKAEPIKQWLAKTGSQEAGRSHSGSFGHFDRRGQTPRGPRITTCSVWRSGTSIWPWSTGNRPIWSPVRAFWKRLFDRTSSSWKNWLPDWICWRRHRTSCRTF